MTAPRIRSLLAAGAVLLAGTTAPLSAPRAASSSLPAAALAGLAFAQHPGATLPADVTLRDSTGAAVDTGTLFGAGRPMILVFDYFRCTTLCGVVLGDLAAALRRVPLTPGRDYGVAAVSIDPGETPADAAALKARHFGRDPAFAGAARFLVGDGEAVRRLAVAAGFPYRDDPALGQYAHPAGVVLVSPGGTISRYLLGIGYDPLDLRLGLVEASKGTIASVADHLLLLCYAYDPARGKYDAAVGWLMRATGAASVLGLGLVIARAARQPRRL
ncbi:SCO family protein [Azospirillum sp. sgz301742]